jgi:hypothetical protein
VAKADVVSRVAASAATAQRDTSSAMAGTAVKRAPLASSQDPDLASAVRNYHSGSF